MVEVKIKDLPVKVQMYFVMRALRRAGDLSAFVPLINKNAMLSWLEDNDLDIYGGFSLFDCKNSSKLVDVAYYTPSKKCENWADDVTASYVRSMLSDIACTLHNKIYELVDIALDDAPDNVDNYAEHDYFKEFCGEHNDALRITCLSILKKQEDKLKDTVFYPLCEKPLAHFKEMASEVYLEPYLDEYMFVELYQSQRRIFFREVELKYISSFVAARKNDARLRSELRALLPIHITNAVTSFLRYRLRDMRIEQLEAKYIELKTS